MHPPHPEDLANAATYQHLKHQLEQKAAAEDAIMKDQDNDGDTNSEDDSEPQKRANRYSKRPWGTVPKPTTLRYYSQVWRGILEVAKSRMRRHVALVNAFPRREVDLAVAAKLVTNSMGEYLSLENHLPLEPGSFLFYSFCRVWIITLF